MRKALLLLMLPAGMGLGLPGGTAACCPATLQPAKHKPLHLILILADDLGWSDLACYGSDLHETPHLDKLARQGVRFTDAYAAFLVCSPTRAAILTGKHPARLGITIWREGALNPPRNRKLLPAAAVADLPHSETTLATTLQSAGYLTALVGKWPLGDADHAPETHGFDVNIGGTHWGAPVTYFFPYRGAFGQAKERRYVPHLEFGKPGEYLTDRLTDEALRVIDRSAEMKRPFFLDLAHHAPHTPIEPKLELVRHYDRISKSGTRTRLLHRPTEGPPPMLSKRVASTLLGCGVRAAMVLLLSSVPCLGQIQAMQRPKGKEGTPRSTPKIEFPHGIFSSSVDEQALARAYVAGALVREGWDNIEPRKEVYDFASLDRQVNIVKRANKQWSLAVSAGPHTPSWWGNKRVEFEWRGSKRSMPTPWDESYLEGLEKLAAALAGKYRKDKDLVLIYVPLISPNGIEGAWVEGPPSWQTLGYTADRHAQAVLKAVGIIAKAFPDKAIALELHEVNRSTEVPQKIIAGLDRSQMGIAIWWLGQGTYQPALQKIFKEFKGAKYGQLIAAQAREPDPKRGYRLRGYDGQPWGLKGVYQQARDLGLRYVEVWPIDLKQDGDTFTTWSLLR